MTSSYNVVLLVDAADSALKERMKLLSLRLLNYLTCRVGLGQVRWSYRFLNSSGGRCRPPRCSDLRELGPRSWDEFEEELEACWERGRSGRGSATATCRASLTHTALLETLSDFQWDRPDISSPTKPALVRGRRGRLIAVDEPMKAEPQAGCHNAVFLLSPAPHSRDQLRLFTGSAGEEPGLQPLMERLLPRGLQDIARGKRVTLYWMDASHWAQTWDSCDHFGYWKMVELMQLVGGRMLPSECLLDSTFQQVSEKPYTHGAPLKIPCDSVLSSLIGNDCETKIQFPQQNGTLHFTAAGETENWECAVTLEPVSVNQKHFKSLIKINLKGTIQSWNWRQMGSFALDTWILQNSSNVCQTPCLFFQQLLSAAMSKGLLLIADVLTEDDLSLNTGILSPISGTAAVLSVIRSGESFKLQRSLLGENEKECSDGTSSDLSDIVNRVLHHVYNFDESVKSPDVAMPEWIKQELSQSSRWSSSVIERWYPISGTSGASSNLMESFRLISAESFDQDEQRYDQDITHYLSECYQKKSSEESGSVTQSDNQKKRLPRTPVRQKMKTMPRALQMLNTARLNSKAQKSQPEGAPVAPAEKSSQAKRRSSEKSESQAKKPAGFKSEDELIFYLKEDYDKAVSGEEALLLSCARNAFTAIKSYLKTVSSKQVEADCVNKIRLLLKSSKMIRQLYGQNLDKGAKLRECQIQALLRMEMCVQCPSIQANEDELEQLVEEVTDMLRIISLTEDPSFLTKFLATVLAEYIESIPKILSDIYFSLGTQIPEELALILPSDGEDSFTREGKTPMYSQPSISRVPSVPQVANEEDQLEELRTRSAKKRRTSTLARHRSIAESSQTLRQIEIPKKQKNKETTNLNPVIMVEKLKLPLPAQPHKEAEATKARRNLFVQENRSPTRRSSKMPRSQSVSAVEGLKHKRSKTHDGTRDHHKLLTKKVMETPAHKQTANRLLYRQIKGRCSESTSDISIVEESPEKDFRDVRRSPRIKQLALSRRNSSTFYASQPKSRNLERVHSVSQQLLDENKKGGMLSTEAKTPKRLLFGEVLGLTSPPARKARRKLLSDPEHLAQEMPEKHQRKTPRKMPQKSASNCEESLRKRDSQKSPCTPRTPVRTPKRLKTPSKSPLERKGARNLSNIFSPSKQEQSTLKSPERRSERLVHMTPRKSDSPIKWLRSPLKTLNHHVTPQKGRAGRSQDELFKSPEKTPKGHSNTNTPGKQGLQALYTPRKSLRLLSSNADTVTIISDQLKTPQKSVAQTPTPKKCVNWKSSVVLPFGTGNTPRKHAAEEDSLSPKTSFTSRYQLRTPQKSHLTVPQTPTPKKHVEWKSSVVLSCATEHTPTKHAAEEDSMSPKTSFTTRYQLRTPQKLLSADPQTPTLKKHVEWRSSVVLPCATEHTPTKHAAEEDSMSPKTSFTTRYPLRTPQKLLSADPQTPTPKKHVEWRSSVVLPCATEHTPTKHATEEDSMSPKTSFTTRYPLRTPQKLRSAVPQTPTPKKHAEWKSSVVFPLASESTPKKSDHSPGKNIAEEDFVSHNTSPFTTRYHLRTPQKSFSPTPKKCAEWKKSVSFPAEYTPTKSVGSLSISPKTTPSFKASASGVLSMPLCQPVFKTPTKSQPGNELLSGSKNASHITKVFSTRESPAGRCPLVSKHTSPVLSNTLSAELKVVLPRLKSPSAFMFPSPRGDIVVCERLDSSSLETSEGSGSVGNTSQTDESIDIAEAKVVASETCDLKMKLLITRKPSDAGSLPSTPKGTGNIQCNSPYGLRHTVDRRQREAEARLGTPQMPSKFSTPKSQKKTIPPPTYEVQLEMRESGLPTLRFKRTDSNSTVAMTSGVRVEDSPTTSCTRKAEDGLFGETWCNKHIKLEAGCASPRLRSSYNTPGKSSLQTLICQSYTPKRCASTTASPTQADAASPWTPSPKYKEKNGSDIINWPRKKKASAVKAANVPKGDHISSTPSTEEGSLEQDAIKASPLNDFVFDGISKLQEHSPVIDWKGKSEIGAMTLKSRKRCFELFSPSKEAQPSSKRSCISSNAVEDLEECVISSSRSLSSNLSSSQQSSCEDEVFKIAVITPPAKVPKSSLSASGLFSLTQSPMLFKGKTPSSKRKMQDLESQQSTPEQKRPTLQSINPDDSPFSTAPPKRSISRTYTRKNLNT
ncbi:treslin [Lithobates pipiens]